MQLRFTYPITSAACREEVQPEEGKAKASSTKFWFETNLPDGNIRIDELVRTALEYYKSVRAKKKKSNTR
jgi:hypothetical protein